MVRILPNGEIDNSPSDSVPRNRRDEQRDAPHRPRNEGSARAPNGPADLFHYANERLLAFGLPRFPIGNYFVEPVHLVIGMLALVLFGPMALIAIGIIIYISQQGGNGEPQQAQHVPRSAPTPQSSRQNTGSTSGNKHFSGTGQRLGS